MRVALVTETYAPEVNGVAMTLGRMVDGLVRRGHGVELVRPRQHGNDVPTRDGQLCELLVRGVPIPRYPGLRFGLASPATLLRHWAQTPPDIVHIATEGPLGWAALRAATRIRLPVSSSFHTNFDAYIRHYGIGWMRRFVSGYLRDFHNRAAVTLVPTSRLQQTLADHGFRNLAVMSRGVDTRLFHPGRRCAVLRRNWGADDDTLVDAYVGRLAPEKNLGLVARTFASLRRTRPDARLLFVGDGPCRAALARRHPEHVFAGLRHGADLAAHYASADLFLFPSLTETFGNVTAEALASGLGVVAYDCAAAADLIRDDRNGRLAPAGDEDAFIRAASALACCPADLARLRGRASPSVVHLDWERIHDDFAATLGRLVACHGKPQPKAANIAAASR